MVATYDKAGARYVAHRDNEYLAEETTAGGSSSGSRASCSGRWLNHRGVTAILYLDTLSPSDGGSLRIYSTEEAKERYVDIWPTRGNAVLFDARETLHEVVPLQKAGTKRTAISLWLTEIFDTTER